MIKSLFDQRRVSRSLAVLAIVLIPAAARSQVAEEWVTTVSGGSGQFVALDPAGNVVVAGKTVVKLDAAGVILWSRDIGVSPTGLAVDNGGNILIVGLSGISPAVNVETVKVRPDGTEAWRAQYDTGAATGQPVGIVVDAAGTAVIGGTTLTAGSVYKAFIVAYDANGAILWQDTYGGNGPNQAIVRDLARDPASGAIYLAGDAGGHNGGALVVRYDADGHRRWVKKYGTSNTFTQADQIAIGPNGTIVFAGYRSDPPDADVDIQVWKVDGGSGKLLWSAVYGGAAADEYAVDIASDGAGNVLVAGTATPPGGGNALLIKYSAAGALSWANVSSRGLDDAARALAVDGSGNAYLTTISASFDGTFNDYDLFTIRYDSAGTTVWTVAYDGPLYDHLTDDGDIVLVGNGDVIVTGTASDDMVTIRYQQP